ncbi:hypothetical protein OfM1_16870 [Lactovum odontotermitis]
MHKKEATNDKKKRQKRLFVLISALVFLLACLGLWFAFHHSETRIVAGLPDIKKTQKMTEGQLKKYADKVVDQNNVTIQVYPKISISSDGVTGKMWVQNPPVNSTGQEASLMTEDGELLYDSGLIQPGYQVSTIKLTRKLTKGSYPGVIAVNFYDLKSKKQVGQTKVDVSITVD